MTETSNSKGTAGRTVTTAALLLLALAAHWRALHAGFHLDDFYRATNNPGIETVAPISRHFTDPGTMATLPHLVQYRPLLPLSLSITHAAADLFEVEPVVAHHAGNLLLHVCAVVLFFFLVCALLAYVKREEEDPPGPFLPFAAAALFAVHPVAGVSVNYVCNRDLLLSLVFIIGALLAYTRAAKTPSFSTWCVCALLLLGGLLSKQNAALFPLIVLAHELTLGRRTLLDPVVWKRVGAFGLLVFAYLAFVRYGIGFSDADQLIIDRPSFEYPLTELSLHLAHYARNIVWPLLLHPLPTFDAAKSFFDLGVLSGALFIAVALSTAWRGAHTRPLLAFSVFAYFGWLAMTSSVIPMRSFAEDYRQLFSLPFACVLVAAGFAALPRRARYPGLGLACLLLTFASNSNARHWESEESLWGHAVELGTTTQGHLNYGRSVLSPERAEGPDSALAEEHYRRALALSPNNVYAKINLALLLVDTGRVEEGMALAEEAAITSPNWAITHYWLARCHLAVGNPVEALASTARAHDLDPDDLTYAKLYADLLHQRARALQVGGQVPESLSILERLHELVDHRDDSRFLHGWALQSQGSLEQAVSQYREHLRVDPSFAKARLNMAYALRDLGQRDEAVTELRLLLSAQPKHVDANKLLESLGG